MNRFVTGAFRFLSLGWLVVHCAAALLYSLPVSPLMVSGWKLVRAVIAPTFQQTWTFFAPNPVSANYALLVKPLTAEEAATASRQGLPANGWYDISTPLSQEFRHSRFSAFDHAFRVQLNAMEIYLDGGIFAAYWPGAPWAQGGKAVDAAVEHQAQAAREVALFVLRRAACAFVNGQFSESRYTRVALRIEVRPVAPWPERGGAPPAPALTEIGIFDLNRGVAPAAFYARAVPPPARAAE